MTLSHIPREALLRRTGAVRRRALLQGLARALCAALVGAGLGPLASAAVLTLAPVPAASRGIVVWACLAVAALAAPALALVEWRRAGPRLSWAAAADLLGSLAPERRNVVVAGADLARWPEGGAEGRGASADLVAAHLERAAAAAADLRPAAAVPAQRTLPAAVAAAATAVLVAAWAWGNPGRSVDAWRALGAPGPERALTVGNLKLVFDPPAYTGLPRAVFEGVSGAVEALRGTRVTLEGQLSAPADTGRWEASDGRTAALEVKGRAFRASWVLDGPGTYELRFGRGGRRVPSDFRPQPLALRPDERPRVELRLPASDVEAPSDAEVVVAFSASDDFRVDRAEVVLQGEVEVRVPVRLKPGPSVEGTARFVPVVYPKLGAGAHLRVEAWDSDNVSGPKVGVSRSVYLSFLDRKRVMEDLRALQERLFEALLGHLADHLERPAPAPAELARLRAGAADVLKLVESVAEKLRRFAQPDTPAAAALLAVQGGLTSVLGPFAAGGGDRKQVVAEVERDILFLDRLLKNLRMEEALSLGDELEAVQRSLFDDLQAGRAPKDLLERVARLEKLLAQMAAKLAGGSGEMPDSFLNADAVKDMPSSELDQLLKKLKEALKAGRNDEAKKLAEKLLDALSRWMRSLQDAAERAAGMDADPAMKELSRLESEVQGLMGDQERVLEETRGVADETSARAAEAIRRELAAALNRFEQHLQVIAELGRRTEALAQFPPPAGTHGSNVPPSLPNPPDPARPRSAADLFDAGSRLNAGIFEVRRALRADLGRARSGVEGLREAFRSLREAVDRTLEPGDLRLDRSRRFEATAGGEVDALLRELEALDRRRSEALTPRDAQKLRGLGAEEGRLGRRTGDLAEKLDDLSRRTPFVGPELSRKARGAQGKMGEAGGRLGQTDPSGAVPPESDALEELSGIARALEAARRSALPGGRGGSGFSLMRRPGGPGGSGGQGGDVDRSRVEIPKEAEARELKAFREEVLKAMRRGGYPKNHEEEVERYYERLIR